MDGIPTNLWKEAEEALVTGNCPASWRKAGCVAETGRGKAAPETTQDSPTDGVFSGAGDTRDERGPVDGMPTEPRKFVEEFGGCGPGATDEDRCKFMSGTAEPRPGHDQAAGTWE